MQVPDDGGQGGRDDGLVQRGQQHPQHERPDDDQHPAVGEGRELRAAAGRLDQPRSPDRSLGHPDPVRPGVRTSATSSATRPFASAPGEGRAGDRRHLGRGDLGFGAAERRRPPVPAAEQDDGRGHQQGAHHEGVEQDPDGQAEADLADLAPPGRAAGDRQHARSVPASTSPAEVTVGPVRPRRATTAVGAGRWCASSRMRVMTKML